ncbi:MAG: hypothetical protein LV481_15890 [Methylacidiphilales bacterium]|nr:hypothetical protein [Candidatus Methylacidiphilales bacterium]
MPTSISTKTTDLSWYMRERVFGLSVACPFDQGNPCVCPLHEIRKLSIEERYKWVRELSNESMLDILHNHQKCLGEKENGLFNSTVDTDSAPKPEPEG